MNRVLCIKFYFLGLQRFIYLYTNVKALDAYRCISLFYFSKSVVIVLCSSRLPQPARLLGSDFLLDVDWWVSMPNLFLSLF